MRLKKRAGVALASRPGRKAKPLGRTSKADWSIAHSDPKPSKKRLTDAQSELAGDYWDRAMRIARIMAKKYPSTHVDWDTAAAFGLCDAAFRFDPSLDNEFWTFAYPRIKYAFIDAMRADRIKGYSRLNGKCRNAEASAIVVMSEFINVANDENRLLTLEQIIVDVDDCQQPEFVSAESFDKAVSCLPRRTRELIRLIYREGLSQKEAGEALGLRESRASQIHADALRRLRESSVAKEALAG